MIATDFSTLATTGRNSKYHFDLLEPSNIEGTVGQLIKNMLHNRQAYYHWGLDRLYSFPVAFSVDYDQGVIINTLSGQEINVEQMVCCDTEELHEILCSYHIFEGEWGLSVADTLLCFENSGIAIFIGGTAEYGPKKPETFMEALRRKNQLQ